ncbi:MAG: DUF86 domain-containing protein [Bacteroidales bacterium]|jgi:uncharacterized protein with HEPN domain|nr:DUF86 domain-containing protein [Bacteroidales bacterium]
MREQVRDKGRLEHILDNIDKALEFTKDVTFEDYKTNVILRYAVVKCVEIIGEASYMLTKEFREKHSEVEWRKIIAMRHILVHGYYQTSDDFVWNVVKNNLPLLKENIQVIYEQQD